VVLAFYQREQKPASLCSLYDRRNSPFAIIGHLKAKTLVRRPQTATFPRIRFVSLKE
jgi:hypothetical protein